jgi:hypothetical protein
VSWAFANSITLDTLPITQGIVAIEVYSTDLSHYLVTEYKAPGETGILRIIEVTGYRLTLVGQNGETLYFDVPTRQFVEGLEVTLTAPTATHLPPVTPTPTWSLPTGYPPIYLPLSSYP